MKGIPLYEIRFYIYIIAQAVLEIDMRKQRKAAFWRKGGNFNG
jgi:hypothetical protein